MDVNNIFHYNWVHEICVMNTRSRAYKGGPYRAGQHVCRIMGRLR
jgi:hypothetical protein